MIRNACFAGVGESFKLECARGFIKATTVVFDSRAVHEITVKNCQRDPRERLTFSGEA